MEGGGGLFVDGRMARLVGSLMLPACRRWRVHVMFLGDRGMGCHCSWGGGGWDMVMGALDIGSFVS